jgi:cytochrome c-type biogenesis protein CcmE
MGLLERVRRRFAETDEERLDQEIRDWASTVPGSVRIASCPNRRRVRLAGVVKRITVTPIQGSESLEAVISDGTSEVSVMWMGRRSIPGLTLGTRVIVDGVVAREGSGCRMVNPTFEFAA